MFETNINKLPENTVIYPYGLGDCLMLTPALREYYENNGIKLNVALLKRFKSSKIFDNNPYINKIFYISNVWQAATEKITQNDLMNSNKLITTFHKKRGPEHKIHINAGLLGFELRSTHMDIFISDEDKEIADKLIRKYVGNDNYGFVQTHTGGRRESDLPPNYGIGWLKKYMHLDKVIEIDKTFPYNKYNINIQFEILRRATAVCLPDSVFYHACSALDKNVDFVYFNTKASIYERVRILNPKIKENVYFALPNIN